MSRSVFLGILLLVGCCHYSFAAQKCGKSQLKTKIVSIDLKTFKVKYEIKNTDTRTGLCALKWNTMMDDDYWASAVEVWQGNTNMPYSKPVIPLRQTAATSSDYQYFKKGEAKEVTQDLSTLFSFQNKQTYWIQIETKINDCYKVAASSNKCSPRKAKKQQELEYNNPGDASINQFFTAQATKKATKQTFSQWLATQRPSEKYTTPSGKVVFVVIGAITKQKYTQLKNAHDASKLYLSESVNYLNNKKKATPLYKDWFGSARQQTNYKHVQTLFAETNDGINQPYVYNMLTENMCGKDFLAHVDTILKGKRQHVVNVCPLFFKQTTTCDSRIVTIIHEMTHDSAATEDEKMNGVVAYGEVNAKQLAATNLKSAIWNAENYALFAEAVHKKVNNRKRTRSKSTCSTVTPKPTKRQKTKPLRRIMMNNLLRKLMQLTILNE